MIARGKAEKKAARTARLSAALRENLKRRKAQVRGQAQSDEGTQTASTEAGRTEGQSPDFRRNRGSD